MNDFQRLQALCDDLERARQEIVKALEDLEAVGAPRVDQSNENLVKLLEESIAQAQTLRSPDSIASAVLHEIDRRDAADQMEGYGCRGAGDCGNCHCLGEK